MDVVFLFLHCCKILIITAVRSFTHARGPHSHRLQCFPRPSSGQRKRPGMADPFLAFRFVCHVMPFPFPGIGLHIQGLCICMLSTTMLKRIGFRNGLYDGRYISTKCGVLENQSWNRVTGISGSCALPFQNCLCVCKMGNNVKKMQQ